MRRSALLFVLPVLAGCPGDQVTTSTLASGPYTLDDDTTTVTLTVDVDALTFTLAEDGGDSVSGTLTALDEADWAECCYLNGSGHSEFETFRTDPAALAIGPVNVTDGAITAAPSIIEYASTADANDGYLFE